MENHREGSSLEVPNDPDSIPEPTTTVELENLIQELYRPCSPPQRISRIEQTIHRVQRGSQGWALGEGLLESDDEKSRFFGALTITVKINQDSARLNHTDISQLISKLISRLILWTNSPGNGLAVRKLISTLVTCWMKFWSEWRLCIKHLAYCLSVGYVAEQNSRDDVPLADVPSTLDLVQTLTADKISVLLWFSAGLADEMCKNNLVNANSTNYHERLIYNAKDAVELMTVGILGEGASIKLRQECITCYQNWFIYTHRAYINAAIVVHPMKTLIQPLMICLEEEDLYLVTADLFTEVLTTFPKFLTAGQVASLFKILTTPSPWTQKYYVQLMNGDFDFEATKFGHLVIAFGLANVPEMAKDTTNQLLSLLSDLLACKGYAVEEDKMFVVALEFWIEFVELVVDSLYEDDKKSWVPAARLSILRAIEKCWQKIQFPPTEVWNGWDSADQILFHDARREVADLLQSSYTLFGNELLAMLSNLVLRSLENGEWAQLEASLFCLGTLSDCVSDEENRDGTEWNNLVGSILGSQLFNVLSDPLNSVPIRTRKTAVMFIGEFASHFERHPQFLAGTLNFLFKTMEIPALARKASHSILTLCSTCRLLLVPELGAFMQHCGTLSQTTALDAVVKEKIIGAISPIIQALPTEEAKMEPVEQLLQWVDQDVNACIIAASQGDAAEAETSGTSALRFLLSIAKGLQVPSDVPVDLEKEASTVSIWNDGAGAPVQNHILMLIQSVIDTLKTSSEAIDVACHIFRAGFVEREPGPFVFPPALVMQFITRCGPEARRPDLYISTACSFINSFQQRSRIDEEASIILTWLLGIMQASTDIDIAASGIHYFNSLMPDYTNVLLLSQSPDLTQFIFMFTLSTLTGNEPIPRAVACDFWTNILTLPSSSLPSPDQLQISLKSATDHFGPLLAEALIQNIAGHAPRSAIDKLCEPLKKLVARQVRSKQWLEAALFREDGRFPSDKVGEKEKRMFLLKIVGLRGQRPTNQAVTEFWLACRGLAF